MGTIHVHRETIHVHRRTIHVHRETIRMHRETIHVHRGTIYTVIWLIIVIYSENRTYGLLGRGLYIIFRATIRYIENLKGR